MHEFPTVTAIGGLCALCGISCMRNFLPTFVFLLVCRVFGESGFAPAALVQLSQAVPPILLDTPALTLFACLSALELAANWNPAVRDLLSDQNWDQYVKPFYTLVAGLVIGAPAAEQIVAVASPEVVATSPETVAAAAPAVVETAHKTVGASSWSVDAVFSCLGAAGTWLLCQVRGKIAAVVDAVDPDNAFGLQSFRRFTEESAWVLFLVLVLMVPLLALFVVLATAGIAHWSARALERLENSRGHACPSCGAQVHGSALRCPGCQADQPRPYRTVAFMGIPGRDSVDEGDPEAVLRHHRTLVEQHRCPVCASALRGNACVCDACGTAVWEQGMTREQLVRRLDTRFAVISVCGCFASAVPVLGFVLTVVLVNFTVLRILRSYDGRLGRLMGRLLFKVLKWSVLLVAILCSSVPFVGVLLLLPYAGAYFMARKRFLGGVATSPVPAPVT